MKKTRSVKPFKTMVAIGDSITMGANATKQKYSWVSRLAELISHFQTQEMMYFNAGISGNLISKRSRAYFDADSGKPSGLERLERDVIAHQPDLVVISYGLNDLRCGTPIEIFLAELDVMVNTVRAKTDAVILIVNSYFMTGYKNHSDVWGYADAKSTRVYNARIKKYAAENRLLYTDAYSAQGEAPWTIDKDGVHPNDLGHQLIANRIFETLATNCSCLAEKASAEADAYFRKDSSKDRWFNDQEIPLRNYDGISTIK